MTQFNNNHSVAILGYQIVLVCYKRNKWLDDKALKVLVKAAETVAKNHDVMIVKAQHDTVQKDHVHIAINANVTTNLVKFINSLKSCSSRMLKDINDQFKWSSGYFISSYETCDEQIVEDYIQDNGRESHQAKYTHSK